MYSIVYEMVPCTSSRCLDISSLYDSYTLSIRIMVVTPPTAADLDSVAAAISTGEKTP